MIQEPGEHSDLLSQEDLADLDDDSYWLTWLGPAKSERGYAVLIDRNYKSVLSWLPRELGVTLAALSLFNSEF